MIELVFLKELMSIRQVHLKNVLFGFDYRCINTGITKGESMNLLRNVDLKEKVDYYKNFLYLLVTLK